MKEVDIRHLVTMHAKVESAFRIWLFLFIRGLDKVCR